MGEDRGGRGGGEAVEPTSLLRQLADEYSDAGIIVGQITMQRITQGVYAVEVQEHGQHERERFFVNTNEPAPDSSASPPPSGESSEHQGGEPWQ